MDWSGHSTIAITLAILGACGREPEGALPDAPAAPTDASIDGSGTTVIDAAIDAAIDAPPDAPPDAPCWSCGLPTGTVSSTVKLEQDDCRIHFVTGQEYPIADTLYVVLKGTSPGALAVDVQMHIADAFVCSSEVAADGSFRCTRTTIYNSSHAIGQITGTTFTVDWYWQEDDYWLKCPMMVGTLQ
jgi:hypothetical protein